MVTYHVDGQLVAADDATVSVRDRGFQYGDAAFETLRVYGGEPFAWDAHVQRLEHSLSVLGFPEVLPPADDLRDRVVDTVAANDFTDAYARLSITRGVQPGAITPADRVDPTIVVVVRELPRGGVGGERTWDEPATLRTVTTRKPSPAALPSDVKTHNYLNGILARLDLQRDDGTRTEGESNGGDPAGEGTADEETTDEGAADEGAADEAILLDANGTVTEGATSNVFFVEDGRLLTPSTDLPLLPGVTRSVVMDLATDEPFPVETGHFDPRALREAEEVFVTNSTWEIRPVTRVDGVDLEPGPITSLLQRLFDEHVEDRHYAEPESGP